MIRRIFFLFVIGLLCAPMRAWANVVPTDTVAIPTPSVIISEVAWSGSPVSTSDEWLELTNLTDQPIDLSGWTLEGAATSGGALSIPPGSIIEPFATFLISNYADTSTSSTLAVTPTVITTSVSLSNSALRLVLKDSAGITIDMAGDGTTPRAGGSSPGFASMVRLSPVQDGSIAESWTSSTESIGFDAGVIQFGTPGTIETWFEPVEEEFVEEVIEEIPEEIEVFEPDVETQIELTEFPPETIEPVAEDSLPLIQNDPDSLEPIESIALATPEPVPIVESTPEPVAEPASVAVVLETIELQHSAFPVGTLLLNEFVSDPITGESEWIEIVNPYNNVIPLDGWSVRDGSGAKTFLPEFPLGFGQLHVVENPKGKLNNDGDMIELLDPTGIVIDRVVYGTTDVPSVKDPDAIARDVDGVWKQTTTPTKQLVNVITAPVSESIPSPTSSNPESLANAPPDSSSSPNAPSQNDTNTISPTVWSGPTTLRITSLYPSTLNDDDVEEFIELTNVDREPLDLLHWSLADTAKKTFVWNTSEILEAGASLTVMRPTSNIALNNTGDTIRLIAPDGSLIDSITYAKAPKGFVLSLINDVWDWSGTSAPTEPTALSVRPDVVGSVVRVAPPAPAIVRTASTKTNTTTKSSGGTATVIRHLTVTVEPGVVASQYFYATDGASAMQIYKNDGVFPALAAGDHIRVSGTLGTVQGEPRLKIGSKDTLVVEGHEEPLPPPTRGIRTLDPTQTGQIVTVNGMLIKRSGQDLLVSDEDATATIRITEASGIDAKSFAVGSRLSVTGALTFASGKPRLFPRSPSDLVVASPPILSATTDPSEQTGKTAREAADQSIAVTIVLVTLAALAGLALKRVLPKLQSYVQSRALRLAFTRPD